MVKNIVSKLIPSFFSPSKAKQGHKLDTKSFVVCVAYLTQHRLQIPLKFLSCLTPPN